MAKNVKTLMNKSLYESEEFKVLTVRKNSLTRESLKKSIINFINDPAFWQSVDTNEIDYCVNELLQGHPSNIDSEDFWWA